MLRKTLNDTLVRTREQSQRQIRSLLVPAKARIYKRASRLLKRGPRCLGVLLCYNDADILPEVIEHMLEQRHDLFVVDHGSDDGTAGVLHRYRRYIVQRHDLPRSFDFYKLYPWVSRCLIRTMVPHYDWISWPDQDEILEGPTRAKNYYAWIRDVWLSGYDWVVFNNMNFWQTSVDDPKIVSCLKRVRHYSLFADCAPRIRAWRASVTNERLFNHNPPDGKRYPEHFNLRHYPMRTPSQMHRRIHIDRANLQRDGRNYHYANMANAAAALEIAPSQLHYDDGIDDLKMEIKFDWRSIYGSAPPKDAISATA